MTTTGIEINEGQTTGRWARVQLAGDMRNAVAVWLRETAPGASVILTVHPDDDGGGVELQGEPALVILRWALVREVLAIATPTAIEVKAAIERGRQALVAEYANVDTASDAS